MRAAVGDRYVLERMRADGYNLGGEQSGHIIMTDHATTGDGLMAALQALAAMIKSGRPASEAFRAFEPVPQLLKNVRVGDANAALAAASVTRAIADAEARLGQGGPHPGAQVRHRAADPRHGRGRRFGPGAHRRRPDHRGDPAGEGLGMKGRVLIVAGSDSGGGAGIQADIKAVTAMNGFAATAITALTAQNTEGVHGVVPIEPAFIAQQIEVVLTDIGADALKTGMLHSAEVIGIVASSLKKHAPGVPLVVDPVMVAKGGHRLLLSEAEAALRDTLLPMAALHHAQPARGRGAGGLPGAQRGRHAARRRAAGRARRQGGADEGRASRGRSASSTSCSTTAGSTASRIRASRAATPTARAARSPRRSPPAWRRR